MKRQGEDILGKTRGCLCFSILAIMLLLPCLSYSQKLDELVGVYFTEVRSGKNPAIPKEILQPENARIVLGELTSYQHDTVSVVRSKVYKICHWVGNGTKQSTLRQTAVTRLVLGCKDEDTGNAGLALDYLTTFRKDDFTASAKDGIRNLVRNKTAHFDKVLKLAGFLELTDLKETIRPYTKSGNAQAIRWAALVTLSRMNDTEAIEEVMRRVRKLPVNDDIVYKVFPDLVYTRHAEAIRYMVEVMQRDDKNCMTADAEREEPIPCGYRIMEQLAPVIKDYPLELEESGDVKAKDYTAALQKVRDWFIKHKDYTIVRDRF
jgi:hypothetical protein